jgi:hypothetical protein
MNREVSGRRLIRHVTAGFHHYIKLIMPRRYRNAGDNVQTHGWSEVFQKDRIALNDLRRPQIVGINVDWLLGPIQAGWVHNKAL